MSGREHGRPADLGRWIEQRHRIYRQIMEHGWNQQRQAFTQHDQTEVLDAWLLMMPLVGFVAPRDPMRLSTLDAWYADALAAPAAWSRPACPSRRCSPTPTT